MLKLYADPSTGITKGQFKRPSSGLDMTLDCSKHNLPDSLDLHDEEAWEFKN